jgi:hypothetical protein
MTPITKPGEADLTACPFCGGTDIFIEPDERGSGGQHVAPYHVGCAGCKCEQCEEDRDDAIRAWNRRAAIHTAPDLTEEKRQALAFGAYLKDCDKHAIQTDTASAFLWGWRAALGTAPATPVPAVLKDHQIAALVNDLRDVAIKYQGAQQLREQIAHLVRAAFATPTSPAPAPATQADAAEVGEDAAAVGAWQHIATAPKDGTHLLLATVDDGEVSYGHVIEGWWQDGWGDAPDDMGCDDGWTSCDFDTFRPGRSFGAKDYQHAGMQPTHWMPLPAAPADSSMGGGER